LFYNGVIMADNSSIEWTNSTWNPVTGCTKVGPGCDHCYAERFAERFRGVPDHPFEPGFDLTLRPKRLDQPAKWRKPRMIFVNSMSDLFHKDVPFSYVDQVFEAMEEANWHTFQVLTKRSGLMKKYINSRYKDRPAPGHIWLGVSIEDKQRLSRLKHLQETNATIRFLSLEPLLGPLGRLSLDGIHWAIVGGESGPGARPIQPEWIREIRDQCLPRDVAFFFKQWGGIRPKTGGRELDGRHWDQLPTGFSPT
jgi:protein gp37